MALTTQNTTGNNCIMSHRHTKHNSTSGHSICNWNTLFSSHKQGTVSKPLPSSTAHSTVIFFMFCWPCIIL